MLIPLKIFSNKKKYILCQNKQSINQINQTKQFGYPLLQKSY